MNSFHWKFKSEKQKRVRGTRLIVKGGSPRIVISFRECIVVKKHCEDILAVRLKFRKFRPFSLVLKVIFLHSELIGMSPDLNLCILILKT